MRPLPPCSRACSSSRGVHRPRLERTPRGENSTTAAVVATTPPKVEDQYVADILQRTPSPAKVPSNELIAIGKDACKAIPGTTREQLVVSVGGGVSGLGPVLAEIVLARFDTTPTTDTSSATPARRGRGKPAAE